MLLKLELLRLDGGTQPRAAMNLDVVEDYAHHLTDGAKFPPVTAFYDGSEYWLADGFHRFQAHRQIGMLEIEADIKQGSRRDAVLHSVGANSSHGLRRTNADKRRAVMVLLEDTEWNRAMNNSEIARQCKVTHPFVASLRSASLVTITSEESQTYVPRTYTTKHGTVATMNTANIGKSKPQQPEPQQTVIPSPVPQITPSITRVEYVAIPQVEELPEPLEQAKNMLTVQAHQVFVRDEEVEPERLIPVEIANAGMRVSEPENAMTRMVDAFAPIINDQQVDGFIKALGKLLDYCYIVDELRQRPRWKAIGGENLYRLAAGMFAPATPDIYPTSKTIDLEMSS